MRKMLPEGKTRYQEGVFCFRSGPIESSPEHNKKSRKQPCDMQELLKSIGFEHKILNKAEKKEIMLP